jgi:micrococcal nuclease
MWTYRAKLIGGRIVDGDTVALTIDLGFRVQTVQSIRIAGVDTPERRQMGWQEAKDFTVDWLRAHHHGTREWPFVVVTEKDKQTFARFIGTVRCADDGEDLTQALLTAGVGV